MLHIEVFEYVLRYCGGAIMLNWNLENSVNFLLIWTHMIYFGISEIIYIILTMKEDR